MLRVFFVLTLCAASLVPVRAAGQKPVATSKTSWGDPDLQRTWSGDSAVRDSHAAAGSARDEGRAHRPGIRRQAQARFAVSPARRIRSRLVPQRRRLARQDIQADLPHRRTGEWTPPLTPEAQRRQATAPRGTYGNGPL